jgi:hypothetical protein
MQSIAFKRGTSFSAHAAYTPVAGQPVNLAGLTVASQVRTQTGELVATLTVALDGDNLGFTASAPAGTGAWPLAVLVWDMKIFNGAAVSYTETVRIVVQQEVTV